MENQRAKYRFRGEKKLKAPNGEIKYVSQFERIQQDIFFKVFRNGDNRMFPKGLSGATHEVIQFLILNLRRDNLVFFDHQEICIELEISPANCKKIKATLLREDLMRSKRGGAYLFNPLYGCFVTGEERAKIYEEYIKLAPPKDAKKENQSD